MNAKAFTVSRFPPAPAPDPDVVRAMRLELGLDRQQAAAIIYKSPRSWEKWETGERPFDRALWELWCIKTGMLRGASL